jgi:hypothetical protein
MMNDIKDLAIKTLREICEDIDAPKHAKASAARTLLELNGDIGKLQSEKNLKTIKALSEMTKAELDAEINRVSRPAPLDSPKTKRIRAQAAKRKPRKQWTRRGDAGEPPASPKYQF